MNEVGCTSGIGWPVPLKLFESGGNVYFDCHVVFDLCGIEKQIKKHGFKFIDKFLLDNGILDSFIFSKNQRSREFISYSAVVMLVIRYQGTGNKADELRKFLLKPLLLPPALRQQSSKCTTSTSAPTVVLLTLNESPTAPSTQPPTSTPASQPSTPVVPPTTARNCTALSSTANKPPLTPASHPSTPVVPPTPARNCTALSSTANKPPSTPASQPLTSACHSPAVAGNLSAVLSPVPNVSSSTLIGGPTCATPSRYHSTKQLVDLQLKRRSQQSSGRKFALSDMEHFQNFFLEIKTEV